MRTRYAVSDGGGGGGGGDRIVLLLFAYFFILEGIGPSFLKDVNEVVKSGCGVGRLIRARACVCVCGGGGGGRGGD